MAKRVMVTQCSAGAQHQCVGCTLVDSFSCTFLELFQAVLKWFPTEYQASILNKLASTMNYQSYHQEYGLRLRLICLPTEKGTLRVEKRSLHAKCLLCVVDYQHLCRQVASPRTSDIGDKGSMGLATKRIQHCLQLSICWKFLVL